MIERTAFKWEDNIKLSIYKDGRLEIDPDLNVDSYWATQPCYINFYGVYKMIGAKDGSPLYTTHIPICDGKYGLDYGIKLLKGLMIG